MPVTPEDIIQRVDALASKRCTWESVWQEVADYVLPRKNAITRKGTGTKGGNPELYNSTGKSDNETLAAGLFAYLCPPNQRWFELKAKAAALNKIESVKRWMSEATRITFEAIAASNFNLQIHEALLDSTCFGTGNLYIEEGEKTALSFSNHNVCTYYFEENKDGSVDTVYRKFPYTARQAVQRFGKGLSEKIIKASEDPKKQDENFEFIHAVFPRHERDGKKIDKLNMPFASVYIDVSGKKAVQEGGYQEFPYMVFRYLKTNNEVYGDSPALSALPEIKFLNKADKTILAAAEKVVEPPWLIPDDGSFSNVFRTSPGALNYWRASNPANKPEAMKTEANIGLGIDLVELKEKKIHRAFYVDLFNMLADKKNMTATEVLERVEERLVTFSPTIGRFQGELFNPMIERIIGILMRAGEYPPLPPELAQYPHYEIVHTSKIAMVVKQLASKAFRQSFEYLMPLFDIAPQISDIFNYDKIAQDISLNAGVPNEWLRPEKEVAQLRQQRAAAQQAAEKAAMIQQAADVVPKLQGETPANSPLGKLMGVK